MCHVFCSWPIQLPFVLPAEENRSYKYMALTFIHNISVLPDWGNSHLTAIIYEPFNGSCGRKNWILREPQSRPTFDASLLLFVDQTRAMKQPIWIRSANSVLSVTRKKKFTIFSLHKYHCQHSILLQSHKAKIISSNLSTMSFHYSSRLLQHPPMFDSYTT